jgi:hypothetical protein
MFTNSPVTLAPREGQHPFLSALERADRLFKLNQSDIARQLEVLPQTVAIWKRFAIEDPNYLLPAEQVPALCVLLAIPPNCLRPDLWPDPEWTFDKSDTIYIRVKDYARSEVAE